jgi:hypothetical protein
MKPIYCCVVVILLALTTLGCEPARKAIGLVYPAPAIVSAEWFQLATGCYVEVHNRGASGNVKVTLVDAKDNNKKWEVIQFFQSGETRKVEVYCPGTSGSASPQCAPVID